MLFRSDGFICFSAAVEDSLHQRYPGLRVERTTLPLFFSDETSPVNWTREAAREQLHVQNKRVLLFFGYIRKYKGLRNLLAAFPAIHREFPDTVVLIVGECYENADEYKQRIADSGVSHAIQWIQEYVPNEDVALYYQAADVVVLPYDSATQSGIVKIAFGFHKPVLATRVGGLAEEILPWHAGEVVEPHNVAALQDGLRAMLQSDLSTYANGAQRAKEANSFERILPLVDSFLSTTGFSDT